MPAPEPTDLSQLPIRRLASTELAAIQDLAYGRDWYYPDRTWQLLFGIGELHGVFDGHGRLLSVGALSRFGARLAAIGMVMTDPGHEGRGLSRRVMSRLIERAGDAQVTLYATTAGRPLYEKLGFTATGSSTMFTGRPVAVTPSGRSRPAVPADLPRLLELDARAMGVDRSPLLIRLFDYADRLRVIEEDGRLLAYGGAWRGSDKVVIGPLIAHRDQDALDLLDDIAASVRGTVRLEAHSERPHLAEWATAHKLGEQATITPMALRDQALPGERELWHVPFSVAVN
ncbi:GNAT family N-acetyltransferase [Streptomyces indicus]|uniref:Acetyltransferase (GNAT) domain-containing protein n=1 Tax=Streptomyces indicus TaxID=417292 RepID=A0A1G9J107_9ACTN|nr:GNAT family N-acetyltransferase [Streptomyces indicus]SDL30804.1 Acetyltransferase (GNAT) domain-containing protein [Streptomyces indicus]